MAIKLDVIIIGSGQAGVPLATRLAKAGRQVMLVERAYVGGTCVNYGCTPTKTLVASARAAHVCRTAGRLGVLTGEVRVDVEAVFNRKDRIVKRWRAGVMRRLEAAKERLRLVTGTARFVGEREIEVSGERYRAEVVVVNVGTRPIVPKMPGIDRIRWLDNHRLLDLRALPSHLIVMGGGYIGCEFAQLFRRFGAEVTIIDRNDHLLKREDADVANALEDVFQEEGIQLRLGATVERVAEKDGGVVISIGKEEIQGSHLLVATGRRPNTDDLGCEAGQMKLDERGFIIANEHYETSARNVYAVGDVLGGPQFTHTSWDDHRILFDHLMGRPSRGRHGRVIPYTVFTDPQVASVGMNETEAKARGVAYEVASMPFAEVARAIESDETAGIMKVLIDPKSEQVLGATLVGSQAGELIHIFVPLMQAAASAKAIADAEFAHPTFAEGVQSLVMKLPRYDLK